MDLRINFDETIQTGNYVSAKGEEFTELLAKVRAINTELQTYWEGTDATKYSSSVSIQAEQMQKLANTINEMGTFLVKVGKAYKEVSDGNANAIN